MAGPTNAKSYNWKITNVSLIASEVDRKTISEAAEKEPVWQDCGETAGLHIWRINNYKVEDWPKDEYGSFYNGDSYIVLNTYNLSPHSEALAHDIHFWIGKYSTEDEYGTAAYKTVELDAYLNGDSIQHREIMDHESKLFKSYFSEIKILEGGAESGFDHAEERKHLPGQVRLFHYFHDGLKGFKCKQVPVRKSSFRTEDVFILDKGEVIYKWIGEKCKKQDLIDQAGLFCTKLAEERKSPNYRTLIRHIEEIALYPEHLFWTNWPDGGGEDDEVEDFSRRPHKLFRLSDASGHMQFTQVKEGKLSRSDLDENDTFIIDAGEEVIVWIGTKASKEEQVSGMDYAQRYINSCDCKFLPVTITRQVQKCLALEDAFN